MISLRPTRWRLRTRVALAFLATTALAVVGLGVFIHVRLSAALEERLRDSVVAEADRLDALEKPQQSAAVKALSGDVHAELLSAQGDVEASSRLVAAPLLGAGSLAGSRQAGIGWREETATVFDDDADAGPPDREREELVLLVRRSGDGLLVVGTSREDADEALTELRTQLLIAGPLALALAGALGYLVAGIGLRPIERMRARAATISIRSAGERLPVPLADDELRRLAVTLNGMLERLDEGLQRERAFVTEASHDLRTPLTLMFTELELALAEPRPPEELAAALHSVHDEVRRLIALAEHLLERAGAVELALPIEVQPVDLVALAHRVADRFRPTAGSREIHVTAAGPVATVGDPIRLDRALSNLVHNAVRHGAGDITVDVSAGPARVVVEVVDRGTGFSTDDTVGVGLSIARGIASAHGGQIQVHRSEGRTIVRMELPAVPT